MQLEKLSFGIYPTPMQKHERLSERFGRDIWIKRDDLCGIALGGNKVRKLQYLLAEAKSQGCDTVFTTGGTQSNHAMLTAACAASLDMRTTLFLKHKGKIERKGNLILNDIYGAQVEFVDVDSYEAIYEVMKEKCEELKVNGRKGYIIPMGGSNALGSIGYISCVEEISEHMKSINHKCDYLVSATGSGGTTAGLVLGSKKKLMDAKVVGIGIATDDFKKIVMNLVDEANKLLGMDFTIQEEQLEIVYHVGEGYAIPNPEDIPAMDQMAKELGILLDPVYTGKAFSKFVTLLEEDYFKGKNDIVFVHTGGAAAIFAVEKRI